MKQALVGAGASQRVAPMIERRPEDRWIGSPTRRVSLAMSGIVLASLAIHAGLLLVAMFGSTPEPVARKEISVELVQEPAPEPKPADKPTPAAKAPPGQQEAEPPKAEPKTEEPKPEEPKPEERKPEPPKPEPQKAETPEPPALRRTEAKPEPQTEPDKLASTRAALETLQKELDTLKAEKEALASEAAAADSHPEPAMAAAMAGDGRIGTLPQSFAAVALPSMSEIDGIATGYQEIVFSQLAKAKGIRRRMGVPGTAGVVFTVDAAGKLVTVSVAQRSGNDALDAEALQIVEAAQPFPKPPPGAQRTFSANFTFVAQAAP